MRLSRSSQAFSPRRSPTQLGDPATNESEPDQATAKHQQRGWLRRIGNRPCARIVIVKRGSQICVWVIPDLIRGDVPAWSVGSVKVIRIWPELKKHRPIINHPVR